MDSNYLAIFHGITVYKQTEEFACDWCKKTYHINYLERHIHTVKHKKKQEVDLLNIVQEKGIVDIIMSYKKELDNVEFMSKMKRERFLCEVEYLSKKVSRRIQWSILSYNKLKIVNLAQHSFTLIEEKKGKVEIFYDELTNFDDSRIW